LGVACRYSELSLIPKCALDPKQKVSLKTAETSLAEKTAALEVATTTQETKPEEQEETNTTEQISEAST